MKRQWHKGPPPEIGWWPASIQREPEFIRWWDGRVWSQPAYQDDTAKKAAQWAEIKSPHSHEIEWTDRWWL